MGDELPGLHVFNTTSLDFDAVAFWQPEYKATPSGSIRPLMTRFAGRPVEKQMKVVKVQLKVCEGCGALWVRPLVGGVYCKRCEVVLSDFPTPQSRKRLGRRAKTLREMACPAGV